METHFKLHKVFLAISATFVVFLLVFAYTPLARAAVTEAYQPSKAAPTVLAWYYGPRWRGGWYRGGWYRNGWYGYHCGRTCFRNRWGYVQCYRRC